MLTSLLLSIQPLTTSGVSSSRTIFFSLDTVQAGPLVTDPMAGPKSGSLDFLSFPVATASTTGVCPPCCAMTVAACEWFVPVLARYGVACRRRVRFQIEYWVLSVGRGESKGKTEVRYRVIRTPVSYAHLPGRSRKKRVMWRRMWPVGTGSGGHSLPLHIFS